MHVTGDVCVDRLFFFFLMMDVCVVESTHVCTHRDVSNRFLVEKHLCWLIRNVLMNLSLCQMSITVCSGGSRRCFVTPASRRALCE